MPPAALIGLYSSPPGRSRTLELRDLHNTDIKKLASVLRDYPNDPSNLPTYFRNLKKTIHDLPHHLRSSSLSFTNPEDKDGKVKPGKLCAGHHGLNHPLIHSVWEILKLELDQGVGHFLYPVIIHAGLPQQLEMKIRQLEPVLQMWHCDFSPTDHTPPDREPILPLQYRNGILDPVWRYQENECSACILARIGSDKDVVFALMAGMVGRYSDEKIGRKGDIKSRRIRFVRYWLKKYESGEKMVDEAWELGVEMRRARKVWKEHQKGTRGKGFYGRAGESGTESLRSSMIEFDITPAFHPGFQQAGNANGPPPRPARPVSLLTVSDVGTDVSNLYTLGHQNTAAPQFQPITLSQVNLEQAYQANPAPSLRSQQASVCQTDDFEWEASSYDSTPSEEITHNHRTHGSLVPAPLTPRPSHNWGREEFLALPKPNRHSMYRGFGEAANDGSLYGGYNGSPPASPKTPVAGAASRVTQWGDFY